MCKADMRAPKPRQPGTETRNSVKEVGSKYRRGDPGFHEISRDLERGSVRGWDRERRGLRRRLGIHHIRRQSSDGEWDQEKGPFGGVGGHTGPTAQEGEGCVW